MSNEKKADSDIDKVRFELTQEQWEEFQRRLEEPAKVHPKLRELLQQKGLLGREE